MRSRLLPILAAAAAILLAARSCSDSQFNPEMDFSEVLGSFSDPGPEFRAMPLWVWNTDVTEADIDAMLGELKDQGFGGAFVHPRPGLVTEYLSDEWFHLWKYALAKAGELGMSLSIYDENSYPSGFAGGLVPDAMPESYNQGQGLVRKAVSGTAPEDTTCFMTVELGGKYYSYDKSYKPATSWNAGFPYVDLLYEGVTDKFIELTFKPYEKALGREMGRSVKAFFSD
ncbi:MAG: hypothetical protein MJY56_02350, partial [Bacteroidales bacterium]|nr:hypothetical protein [Bacteroidales bacterium]